MQSLFDCFFLFIVRMIIIGNFSVIEKIIAAIKDSNPNVDIQA